MVDFLRGRENRRFLASAVAVGAVAVGACLLLRPAAALAVFLVFAAMLALSLWFTRARCREIAELSDCLGRIAGGDYSIDLREYAEGELGILKDELYKVTRTLASQAERLRRDKTYLADTLADISHQLKTPLTSVGMMTELLAQPGLPEGKREEFLQGIRMGCERIRWLTMALLKLSRLDAGAVVFRRETATAAELVERAVGQLRIPMELKNQTFTVEAPAGMTVECDPEWLAEALGNLIKNGVEHTPEGGEIRVRVLRNPIHTAIEVRDSGPGIPAGELAHIFERFYRGEHAAPDSVGIGLALCKSIVTRMGGTVEARSAPGEGTAFTVKLYDVKVEPAAH